MWKEDGSTSGEDEMNIRRRIRIIKRQNRRFWKAIARKDRRIAKLKRQLKKLDTLASQLNEMKDKLKPVWSTELDDYFEERYGIDINEVMCDAVQEAIRNEIQKDEEKLK
jgi:chromosome segregation ATPase